MQTRTNEDSRIGWAKRGLADVMCWECGAPAEYNHHVIPRSRGGIKTVPLCGVCHGLSHHRDERMATSVLTSEALQKKKARGELVSGKPPYGYRLADDGTHLDAEPREQRVIALVQDLRAEGLTIRAIADRLNADNVPARGKRWHPTTIARLLKKKDAAEEVTADEE